jgi:hypothetical protein
MIGVIIIVGRRRRRRSPEGLRWTIESTTLGLGWTTTRAIARIRKPSAEVKGIGV